MEEITQSDMATILKAAVQMSNVDSSLSKQEKDFLKKLFRLSKTEPSKIRELKKASREDIDILSRQLSSQKAKKAFLLTLATMALADGDLAEDEKKMLEELTTKLEVGRVKLDGLTYENSEAMVLKLLSVVEKESAKKKAEMSSDHLSDFDML
ncbi:MAG: TerB family tellurite resistance protein [Proteobacteria bacterium]|nr:TerB family tellurite resistance protein [Pseudomonadota bacterium]